MNNELTTFYIVRHGQTEWNVAKRIQGQSDSPLTEAGIQQASDLAKELQDVTFDLAFSSDLLRAKRTAEIIVLERKLAVETSELLRERNFGQFEGKSREALKEYDALVDALEDEEAKYKFKFAADDESDEDITQRLMTFLRETAITHPGKTILVTTHGGVIRAFIRLMGLGTYKTLAMNAVSNAAYVKVATDGIDFFVKETKGIKLPEQ